MSEEDLSKSDLIEMIKNYRIWVDGLSSEREEARAELAEATIQLTEARRHLEELDFLRYEGGEESIGREIEKAEARGYERGVREAERVVADGVRRILALLEKPKQT
jgi:hypothetical protein